MSVPGVWAESTREEATMWLFPCIVAHCSGRVLAPQDTLAAIRTGAARRGARMIEFNAKPPADNAVFPLRDDTADRAGNGRGAAAKRDYASIARLDAGL